MTALDIIKSWDTETHRAYGVADMLRSAAMECQDDHPEITAGEFAKAAEEAGFAKATAARCWSFVKKQGA